MAQSWSIRLHKEKFKFSAAHFLIFADGSAEQLHGHNYRVGIELKAPLADHGMVLNFRTIKPMVTEICGELDEHFLVPQLHPEVVIEGRDDGMVRIQYRDRYYLIPANEVISLPIDNTSAENLAAYLCGRLEQRLQTDPIHARLEEITVTVEETSGQMGAYRRTF